MWQKEVANIGRYLHASKCIFSAAETSEEKKGEKSAHLVDEVGLEIPHGPFAAHIDKSEISVRQVLYHTRCLHILPYIAIYAVVVYLSVVTIGVLTKRLCVGSHK